MIGRCCGSVRTDHRTWDIGQDSKSDSIPSIRGMVWSASPLLSFNVVDSPWRHGDDHQVPFGMLVVNHVSRIERELNSVDTFKVPNSLDRT